MSLNLLRSGPSGSCISTWPQQAEAGPQGPSLAVSSFASLAFSLHPHCLHIQLFPRHQGQGSVTSFCICAIAFLSMELGESEVFLVMMSLENVEEIEEAKRAVHQGKWGSPLLRGCEEYS